MPRKILVFVLALYFLSFAISPHVQSAQSQVRHQQLTIALPAAQMEADGAQTFTTDEIAVPLTDAEPFLAVAPMLTLSGEEENIRIRYRAAQQVEGWGEWQEMEIDRDATPRGSGRVSALLFFFKDTVKVQFQVRWRQSDNSVSTQIADLKVSFISPGATRSTNSTYKSPNNLSVLSSPESATAKYPKPVITTRTGWGCPDGQGNTHGTPSYTTVTHLIVHHTVNANTSSDWAAVVRSIWNFHIFTNGWSDLGYNYLIDPNGVIYEGRGGGDNVVGAHFSCQNGATMGVALLGTFTSVQPTDAARNSLKEILSWKADQRNLDPAGSSVHSGMQQSLAHISGHRDGNGLARSCTTTECPGNLFYPTLSNLRTEVKEWVNPANDFLLTSATTKQVIAKGGTVTFPISSATTNGAAQIINLSTREVPSGISSRFGSNSIPSGNGTQLTLTVPETTPSGTYLLTVIGTGTTKRSLDLTLTVTGTVASVSAASYQPAAAVATESLISAFGVALATETKSIDKFPLPTTLADVTVRIKDSQGTELAAPLFYVSPTQINYQIPPTLALGTATVTITHKTDITAIGTLNLTSVAPGLFSANATGQGVAAGQLQRRKADGSDVFEPLAQYDEVQKLFLPRQLDLRTPNEQYFLTLFGTGIRFRNPALAVSAEVGGVEVEVLYAGEQKEFVGLDQVNLRLTPELVGKGQVSVIFNVAGKSANPLTVSFR